MIKLFMDAMLISIFWFIALYTLNTDRIRTLITRKPKIIFGKKTIFFSKLIILIWMIFEAFLMLGSGISYIITVKKFVSGPVISHALYLTHLFVLFTATRHLTSKTLESEKYLIKAEKKLITFSNGLIVLGISIIIFFLQSIMWGELKYIYTSSGEINLLLEIIIDGLLILVPGVMILRNVYLLIRNEKTRLLALRISVPIILLMGFSQIIMTKVVVFYDFMTLIHRLFLKQFGIRVQPDKDDKLMIGSSMTYGSVNAKINVYFLTAYFITLLILWTSQVSPLPIQDSVYANGLRMSFLFSIGILSFWMLEFWARSFVRFKRVFRVLFIPILIALTVLPFYTQYANANFFTRATEVVSIYHKLGLALGSSKIVFFLCIILIQASVAYILHIITGEAHNDRHYYSILPIIGIVQLMVLSILYPIMLTIPPYVLDKYKIILSILIFVFAVGLIIVVGLTAYRLFTSKESEWSLYVHEYWKDKVRLMIIVSIITAFSFIPIGARVINPIHNINLKYGWEMDYIKDNERYLATNILQTADLSSAYILSGDDKGNTKLTAIATEDGKVLWEKVFNNHYVDYKVWNNGVAVFTKVKNSGFSIVDLKTGFVQYDYTIKESNDNKDLNVEVNDRMVLYTANSEQFIYDMMFGVKKLDTIGDNYYQLIPGDQCALTKNNDVYLYQFDRWEKMTGTYNIENAELLYYDENGLIVFGKDKIERFNYNLTIQSNVVYNKVFQHIMTNNKSFYTKLNNDVAFYLYSKDEVFAYLFDTSYFTFKVIPLEQRVKEFKDYQKIQLCNEKGSYFLYDNYQFTLYKNDNIISRQWYELPITKDDKIVNSEDHVLVGQPIKVNEKIIWIEKNGMTHCMLTEVQ